MPHDARGPGSRSARVAAAWLGLTVLGWGLSVALANAITGAGLMVLAAAWYVAGVVLAWRVSGRRISGRWVAAVLLGTTFPAWMWAWVIAAGESGPLVVLVPSVVTGLVLAWATGWWRRGGMVVVAVLAGVAALVVGGVHAAGWRWLSVPHGAWNAVVSAGLLAWAVRAGRPAGEGGGVGSALA